ncbi:MAG: DeoR/GlpR family DNA-binding transcription regulator [Candidatus Limiplasma sp.]|nr:DeoR/GlpR family DNA-binding transcription regulator [Candidatus Limiplasma sp.]
MYNVERKALIMDMLQKENAVSVAELAQVLSISKETVRRDLRELELDGMIRRTHGGAVCEQQSATTSEHPFNVREIQHYGEKARICQCAAKYAQDGDTIFVDNSSTTISLLKHINPNHQITVITNSIRQLFESTTIDSQNMTMICLGGVFRAKNYSLAGGLSVDSARNFRPSKAFISCRAIEPTGLSDGSIYEVETKRALIATAKEVIVLADSSKFEETGTVFLSDLKIVTRVITDEKVSKEAVRMLEMAGVEVVIAS